MRGVRESVAGAESGGGESLATGAGGVGAGEEKGGRRPKGPVHERSFVGPTEIDGIHAMVDGVKARGVRLFSCSFSLCD